MLITEALAQVPNPQAIVEKAAESYFNQGVLGTTCIFLILLFLGACWVARSLYKDLKECNATALADRDKLILAQQAAAAAAEKVVSALEGLKATLDASKDASEDLTKQVELAGQETRHAMANIQHALNGIADRMNRGRP